MHLNIVLPMIVFVCCQSNVWNGIVPLKSTRADVEKILGAPGPGSVARHAASYNTKDGKVFVLYSTGPCGVEPSNGWNLPELTVISINVYPDPGPKITDLPIDERKFEKRPDPEILNLTSYTNEKDGISLTVDTWAGEVTRSGYYPESKYDHLKCENHGRK